ncbi:MAG: hypothetical protein AAGF67_03915 [Verrucomicrobiota bacterium]
MIDPCAEKAVEHLAEGRHCQRRGAVESVWHYSHHRQRALLRAREGVAESVWHCCLPRLRVLPRIWEGAADSVWHYCRRLRVLRQGRLVAVGFVGLCPLRHPEPARVRAG